MIYIRIQYLDFNEVPSTMDAGSLSNMLKVGDGYKGKYPLGTTSPAVVRCLSNEPDCRKRVALARRLRDCYLAGTKTESQ